MASCRRSSYIISSNFFFACSPHWLSFPYLFIIRSWDGNHPSHGADIWNLTARGVGTLLHTTFSNWSKAKQAYPKPHGLGDFHARTGAAERDTLGYAFRNQKDSVYRLSFTFGHGAKDLTLHFSACGLEGPVDLESWGLDNVKVMISSTGLVGPKKVMPVLSTKN